MNKAQFIAYLAPHFGDSKKEAARAVDMVFDAIVRNISKGDDVMINDFGKFKKVDRPARKGRNPFTGETIQIKASARKLEAAPKPPVKVLPKVAAKVLPKVAVKVVAKPAAKKVVAKPIAKKPITKKPVAKKVVAKPAAKKVVAKPVAKKPIAKKPAAKKVVAKPVAKKPAPVKKAVKR
jgi:DNA-binding protein HU-beta